MMLTPSMWSSIPVASPEESLRVAQTLQAPFYHIRRTWPMPAAGMYPGLVPVLVQENGPDIIIPAGGGMLGHPMGYKAGAMAWRQAIDATMADISLQEYAKTHPELRAACELWGIRERPKTPWGYSGPEYHPKFAAKNL
jgi:2,3-diketo-5-methylthiopentyl-1-phosphate enolase